MLFINYPTKDQWRELGQKRKLAFNYFGGYCDVDENALENVECVELSSWHELYVVKHYCPLKADIKDHDVWISPDGNYYNGDAHEVVAEDILQIIYGEEVEWCAGDRLEAKGWIRACSGYMWPIRVKEYSEKEVTQAQYDALWDYCNYHHLQWPDGIVIR